MKRRISVYLPFLIMPALIPIYWLLDKLILVDVFGCGCVPSVQENMLGIAFNSNDLRLTVFSLLTISLSLWSLFIARGFRNSLRKWLYCASVIVMNTLLALWVIKTFMWL